MTATPSDALHQILETASLDTTNTNRVAMLGADPILPSQFLIGTAGASVLSAVGIAVSDLWKLRGGKDQDIAINVRSGAMAMRSNTFLQLDGGPAGKLWGDISGFYKTKDNRWMQFHCNYPHHRDGVLSVLGCDNNKDAVNAATSKWLADDLDHQLAKEGLCAAKVRSPAEWANHKQADAISQLPLMEINKIADSPPEPFGTAKRPLSGIRALDLSRVLAGPVCGRTLAEHGADVLRISGEHLPYTESLLLDTGHGKRSAHVDLRTESGKDTLRDLIKTSDIFLQAYRPGTLQSKGFGPHELASLRPGIIYVTLSAYGHEGPWANRRGFDSLVQSASGLVDEHSGAGIPRHLPAQALDYATGYLAAFGAMVALARRARDGGSYLVRLSLAQTGHWINNLGRIGGKEAAQAIPDPTVYSIPDLLTETDTHWGKLTHMRPVLGLSETPPKWELPPIPLGSSQSAWPQ
jgi:crotonobetainyl-CoA:carnitine CoA-transferase CaiB-like acyl-CoA transferase